jgi:hypothetical protein
MNEELFIALLRAVRPEDRGEVLQQLKEIAEKHETVDALRTER